MAKMTGFKVFKGTKDAFISSGKASANVDAIVFITGGDDAKGSAIYAQGVYFANFAEFLAAINYVKGVTVGGQSYNASAGGGYVAFEAVTPGEVTLDVSGGKIKIGLTAEFINKVNNTATNLGASGDAANASGSAFARIAKLAEDLASLKGNGDGSIEDMISDAIADLRAELSGDWSSVKDLDGNPIEAQTIAEVYASMTEGFGGVSTWLGNIDKNIGSVSNLSTTSKEVVGAINEVLAAVGTGGTAAVVSVTAKGASGDYAQVYEVTQGGVSVGTINIPKDMVVTGGEVVTNPSGKPAGTYIKLSLQNVAEPLYIDVAKLVDIYTAKANAAQVQVAISGTNEISASIVAGSISSTELGANAVVTAKIADKNVTKAKLADDVQTSLGKADSAYQKPSTGIAKSDLASGVQSSLDKADSAVQSVSAEIATNSTAMINGYITVNIADAKNPSVILNVGTMAVGTHGVATVADTKAYVDGLWEWEEL